MLIATYAGVKQRTGNITSLFLCIISPSKRLDICRIEPGVAVGSNDLSCTPFLRTAGFHDRDTKRSSSIEAEEG